MALEKAVIEILDKEVIDPSRGLKAIMPVQFNPAEYSLNKGAQIAEIAIPGLDSPLLQFVRGQNEKLTLEFFFDTTESGMGESAVDVRSLTDPFYLLAKIQPKTHAPPRVRFVWGEGIRFKAIIESVGQKFSLFNPNGIPLRATLSMSFREYKTLEDQVAELNLQSADHRRRRVVQRGETLVQIAAEVYDDPGQWRAIAEQNGISNPLHLAPGTELDIPALDTFRIPVVAS
ncbi:MAG: LysM peptidoglycan-binding domain-containing protein [Candidatus Promineifilaceae bacterium]|nr:LysM peptidoglycan-binding domain-containing protein [Candidatus Promineifilaceae bacterium]